METPGSQIGQTEQSTGEDRVKDSFVPGGFLNTTRIWERKSLPKWMMDRLVNWVWSCGLSLSTCTTAVLFCCVALLLFWRPHSLHTLPPGPYGLPVVGYLPWLNPSAPHQSLCELVSRYGKVVSVRLGGVLVVVLADPQLVRDVLGNKDTAGRAPLYLTHGIMKGYGKLFTV
ncbi:hypothetical protein Pcinc_039540 [Petrolisthes cinctipes]|uniref:Uncharacterized protein n=1 Tax=Petrolisthes cinctipes TaxID=88211 RepID=A0AAE1BR12_PETCI|nr:hypothetical protein Pcinc_039540 [Petrolisthes cinctipes]